jgi:iron(III) transport system substrate-binding protein
MRIFGKFPRTSLLCALVSLAWGIPGASAQSPHDSDKIWPYLRSLTATQRQTMLEQEALKEGSVTVYGGTGIDRLQFWAAQFNKHYPNIKVNYVRLTEEDLVQRTVAEEHAHRVGWADFDPRFLFGSADQGWVVVGLETFPVAIAWRTDRISSAEAPKTLADLENAKWKGRVGTVADIEQLASGLAQSYGPANVAAQLGKLAALDNHLYSSHAALGDALAQGDIDIAWNLITGRPDVLKKKGAPVEWAFMNPLYGTTDGLYVLKDAAHPYAAALFEDVLLSPETLEASDKWDPGRLFGNKKGKFAYNIDQFPSLVLYPPVDPSQLTQWSKLKESLFIRHEAP